MLLSGFDYKNGIYYYNVGEGVHRDWNDYRDIGFISAGQGRRWRDAMLGFQVGDVIAAYLKGCGFIGIGRILERAQPIRNIAVDGKPLLEHKLRRERMYENYLSDELSEFVCRVEWIVAVDRNNAKWKPKSNLYTTTHVRASLDGQPQTIAFLEEQFKLSLHDLVT